MIWNKWDMVMRIMINTTSRQLNIIKTLLSSNEPMSSIALSQAIGCSTKTIQSEIKEINKVIKKGKIVSIRGVGYKIEGSLEELDLNKDIYNDIDRVGYIIKELLNLRNEEAIKLEDLADSMYVSVSTVKNDLKEVKEILKEYNIKVATKHKQGILVLGREKDIVACISDLCNKKENELSISDFLKPSIKNNIFSIKNMILDILNDEKMILTDIEFKNILNFILISLSRNIDEIYENELKSNIIYEKIKTISSKEQILKSEKEYIKKYIIDYKNKRNDILNNNKNKELILNSIKEFTQNLKTATSIDIIDDKIFEECLYNHINNLYKRTKLGINQNLIGLNDIKIKYPFAFELAKIAKKTIEKNLDINISEEEISSIALHVGGAIERSSQGNEKRVLKTIIVCTSGIGTSMLIKSKLENIFKDRLEILKIIPSYLVDYINAIDVDFVISTVPLQLENIPVINVSAMLTDKEIKMIEKYIETGNVYMDLEVESLIETKLFFIDIDLETKEEVINYMADKLIEYKYIDKDMKQSYLEREQIATTEIGNMVAIPHGANGIIYESKVAIGILKNPINWEIGKVRLVIMLAVDKDKILDYEELFLNIYKRVDSIAKVISICENKNFEKFSNMFKR
ncbi:BglG family transcription antiterminator [Romboutsia lituseburensis]|uniref:BglG family transcription antiterminator n=1 Tax=Romboutsia lituseburensis TaxID=1537 RepID=UPI00215A4292|nr:BglG family transcription antiterminator [Romboutsia lituseburensis]MCR8746888.1 BglG family transcription antiterminator [Romboutsia lituseburensis]